jgi:hypothetical protein
MTQHPIFEGHTVFQSIGFHAALILNRLRNERAIADESEAEENKNKASEDADENARRELADLNRRLARLSARVREEP